MENTAKVFGSGQLTAPKIKDEHVLRHSRGSLERDNKVEYVIHDNIIPFGTQYEQNAYDAAYAKYHDDVTEKKDVSACNHVIMACANPKFANLSTFTDELPADFVPTKKKAIFDLLTEFIDDKMSGKSNHKPTAIVFVHWQEELDDYFDEAQERKWKVRVRASWSQANPVLPSTHLPPLLPQVRKMTGKSASGARDKVLTNFKSGQLDVLFISKKTGCTSYNFQEQSSFIVLASPDWNPMTDYQAMCRVIRLGQDRKVDVYRFAIQDTMEHEVLADKQLTKIIQVSNFTEDEDIKKMAVDETDSPRPGKKQRT